MRTKEQREAVLILEHAGTHIVRSQSLRKECLLLATEAARHHNPDVNTLAILSVALAEVIEAKNDGWVNEIKRTLGLEVK